MEENDPVNSALRRFVRQPEKYRVEIVDQEGDSGGPEAV
jgi:ribosomal protein S21